MNDSTQQAPVPPGQVDIHAPFTLAERFEQLNEIEQDITALLEHAGRAVQALTNADSSKATASGMTTAAAIEPGAPQATALPQQHKEPDSTAAREFDPQARLAVFKASMNSFLSALDSVDKRLKRQIYGLEEADIITLRNAAAPTSVSAAHPGGAEAGYGGEGEAMGREGGVGGVGGAGGAGGGGGAAAGLVRASLEPNGMGKIGTLDVGWLNANGVQVERGMESELWTQMREHLKVMVEKKTATDEDVIML